MAVVFYEDFMHRMFIDITLLIVHEPSLWEELEECADLRLSQLPDSRVKM